MLLAVFIKDHAIVDVVFIKTTYVFAHIFTPFLYFTLEFGV